MTDPATLAERILAAIEEAERQAQHAAGVFPGEWHVDRSTAGFTIRVGNRHVVVGDPTMAYYIEHRQPSTVLRDCAADRRVLERHELAGVEYPRCAYCGENWPCPDVLDRAEAYGIEETT